MIIKDLEYFLQVTKNSPDTVVVDVETKGTNPNDLNSFLLGVSICWKGIEGIYIPISHQKFVCPFNLVEALGRFLSTRELIGWNIEFDRKWIDHTFIIKSNWKYDARCMWYLTDKEQKERGYGLKSAQIKLLGWSEKGDKELSDIVTRLGGKLSNGDHYMAPTTILGRYANLDTFSTLKVFEKLLPDIERLDYFRELQKLQEYGHFLAKTTEAGVLVDVNSLESAKQHYEAELTRLEASIRSLYSKEIRHIESLWHQKRIKSFKRDHALKDYLADYSVNPKKFNIRSGPHKAKLLHNYLDVPITERTPTGQPKASRDVFEKMDHPAAKIFAEVSENAKLLDFVSGYLDSVDGNLIHFPHNWCATVTGRLGGFKPYDLNMPFNEERIMKAFSVGDGYIGIHMDLKAVEPTVIAAFSKDPNLIRLYQDGVGDVYLDLALELFPNNLDLKRDYNPLIKTESEIKTKYKSLRNVAKIVHLAVGYTGTGFTISKNLTKARFLTTIEDANIMVNRYWAKYISVKQFEQKLQILYDKQGYLRSVGGGYIWVPKQFRKDLMNRFVQRSGHDILVCFIGHLYRIAAERGIALSAVLPDIHDSHSAKVPTEQLSAGLQAFEDSLSAVNAEHDYGIKFGMEVKTYHTFYGLKGDE